MDKALDRVPANSFFRVTAATQAAFEISHAELKGNQNGFR